MGAKCELDTVFSKQNIIPRKVNAKCDLALYGQYVNLMDVSDFILLIWLKDGATLAKL